MPTYTYYCFQCDRNLDRNVSVEERNNQDCYNCKNPLIKKIGKPAGIHIK